MVQTSNSPTLPSAGSGVCRNGRLRRWAAMVAATALAAVMSGCADERQVRALSDQIDERNEAIRAEAAQIAEQRSAVDVLAKTVSAIEEEQARFVGQLNAIKKESPTISSCVLNGADFKGAVVAIFGETEAQRTAAGFVAAVCFLARLHDDYPGVERSIGATLSQLRDVTRRLAQPAANLREAEAKLSRMVANQAAPRLQAEVESLRTTLACERDFFCRVKRLAS